MGCGTVVKRVINLDNFNVFFELNISVSVTARVMLFYVWTEEVDLSEEGTMQTFCFHNSTLSTGSNFRR